MKILAIGANNDSPSMLLASYAASLFENALVEYHNLDDKEVVKLPENSIVLAEKIDQAHLLIVSLEEQVGSSSSTFKSCCDELANIPSRKAFGGKPILLLTSAVGSTSDPQVLEETRERFSQSESAVLETFRLSNFNTHFEDREISTLALRLELIRKVNRIKQSHFSMYNKYEGFTCGIDPDRGGWHGDACGY